MKEAGIIVRECKRVICSKEFIISCILGIVVCLITFRLTGTVLTPTVHKYIFMHYKSISFLAYIAAMLPCASSVYDDMKCKNIYSILGRISMKQYLISKMVSAAICSMLTFMIGKLVFILGYSMFVPMGTKEIYQSLANSLYMELIIDEKYFTYMFLTSFQRSMYVAILCQIVILVSIIIPNKSLMYAIPIAIFYVGNYHLKELIPIDMINYTLVFQAEVEIFASSSMNFLYAILLASVTGWGLYKLALGLLRYKIHGVGWRLKLDD